MGQGGAMGGMAPAEPDAEPPKSYQSELERLTIEPWMKVEPRFERWIARIFEGSWADQLRSATDLPLGVVENPKNSSFSTIVTTTQGIRLASNLFLARAKHLRAKGNHAAALDHLLVVLNLSRHLRSKAEQNCFQMGLAQEERVLTELDRWLQQDVLSTEWLRRAFAAVKRHDAGLPPVTDSLKAEYVFLRHSLENARELVPSQFDARSALLSTQGDFLAMAFLVPWEKARRERLYNAVFAGNLRFAEADYERVANQLREDEGERAARPESHSQQFPSRQAFMEARLRDWLPPDAENGPNLSHDQLRNLVAESWLAELLLTQRHVSLGHLASLCRVRGVALQLALALYERQEGKPAQRLEELAPRHFTVLQIDAD